jgi:6-phosphogluconolactonase
MAAVATGGERSRVVYIGTYTEPPSGKGEGIYVCRLDPDSGTLSPPQIVRDVANPSFLALDANRPRLYAVNELEEGGVSAFARDPQTGDLRFLNRQPSHGAAPCYVGLDTSGRYALVANYNGGTVAALPIAADGSLGPATGVVRHEGSSVNPQRQEKPHPHMIAPTPDGRFVLATDLGTDRILIYRLDLATGRLLPNEPGPAFAKANPGSGPRHFAFAPNGRTLYVINEIDSTLTAYAYEGERGAIRPRQTVSSLPVGFEGESTCAHVVVAPDGRFVYGSNRGHDSIAIWAVDGDSGDLTPVGHESTGGRTPRNFAIDPSGSWLLAANQESDTVVTFRRDRAAGTLTATGRVDAIPSPVAIVFAPA